MTKNKLAAYILVDRSGSMVNLWNEALNSINSYVDEIKKTVKGKVTVVFFDAHTEGNCFNIVRDNVTLSKFKPLSDNDGKPRGLTPLFDAAGKIFDLAEKNNEEKTVVVIMTDGNENSSIEYDQQTIQRRVKTLTDKKWEVLFLGANFDASHQTKSFGLTFDKFISSSSEKLGETMRFYGSSSAAYTKGLVDTISFSDKDKKKAQ